MRCTHKHCQGVCPWLVQTCAAKVGDITETPFVHYMRAGSRDGKRKLKKIRPIRFYCFPGDEEMNFDWRKLEKGEWHGEAEMGGARVDS